MLPESHTPESTHYACSEEIARVGAGVGCYACTGHECKKQTSYSDHNPRETADYRLGRSEERKEIIEMLEVFANEAEKNRLSRSSDEELEKDIAREAALEIVILSIRSRDEDKDKG